MNSLSSVSIFSHSHLSDFPATRSSHQISLPCFMGTSTPVLLYTTTFCTDGVLAVASSTFGLRASGLPRL